MNRRLAPGQEFVEPARHHAGAEVGIENQALAPVLAQVEMVVDDAPVPVLARRCAGNIPFAGQYEGNGAAGMQGGADIVLAQRAVLGLKVMQCQARVGLRRCEIPPAGNAVSAAAADGVAQGGDAHAGGQQRGGCGRGRPAPAGGDNMGADARVIDQVGGAVFPQHLLQYVAADLADLRAVGLLA